MSAPCILLVGGGTGGHVFPMIAVADALRQLQPDVSLVFAGTKTGLEARVVPARGYPLELIEASPLRGGGLKGVLRGGWSVLAGLGQARALMRKHSPAVVFSLGGYVAGAVSVAARLARVPLALMEPNSVAGFANRLIAPFAQRAYVAFEETEQHLSKKICYRSGVALRSGFEPRPYTRSSEALKLLILGGSQGARALNQTLPAALAVVQQPLEVVHQAGKGNGDSVAQLYKQLCPKLSVRVLEFIDDMPSELAASDLVISRSGASAVSEICAIGRPSILIPFEFAADNHQMHNALALQKCGAALCVSQPEATAERISATIAALTADPAELVSMAQAARAWGRPLAAQVVARDLLQLGGLLPVTESNDTGTESVNDRIVQRSGQLARAL